MLLNGCSSGDLFILICRHNTIFLLYKFNNFSFSSTIFLKVFGMTRSGIEPRSPRPLANILPTRPMNLFILKTKKILMTF